MQRVWCGQNESEVARAAQELGVYSLTLEDGSTILTTGGSDTDLEQFRAVPRGELVDGVLPEREFLYYSFWQYGSPVAFSRACAAAFELRP